MLKLQVDIARQEKDLFEKDKASLEAQIAANKKREEKLQLQMNKDNHTIVDLSKRAQSSLTKGDLAKLDEQFSKPGLKVEDLDKMSEFSVATQETSLGTHDNILDIRFNTAQLDQQQINSILGGGRQLTDAQVKTFLLVDFYNHDSQQSDTVTGFTPVINTQFSFKNTVDSFYLKHLDTETMQVDVMAILPSTNDKFVRLGTVEILLQKLFEKDYKFQVQDIVHQTS